ncbi:hypothetical protein ACQR3P_29150 [Rhodococcus sp. IEGM1300]
MNQEERFALDDEKHRIASIVLTPEMKRDFESRFKISEVVTGTRRIFYDPKNTLRRHKFMPDNDQSQVWLLGDKGRGFTHQVTLFTFEDEAYNHLMANLHNRLPEDIDEHVMALINDDDICTIEKL